MSKIKVLVVEDGQNWQDRFAWLFGKSFDLLQATRIEDGERLFSENPDVGIIIMDACVPGDRINTIDLVRKIRETFSGKMVASSSSEIFREHLVKAGCSHSCHKDDLFEKFLEIVNS